MKNIFVLLLAVVPAWLYSQPVIRNAENFPVGTLLKFDSCDATDFRPGPGGANQNWDFSGLVTSTDTIKEWIVAASSTPKGSKFPAANLSEKYSDGSYTYIKNSASSTELIGYFNPTFTLKFTKPMLIAKRPMSYTDSFTNPFTDSLKISSLNGSGTGTCTVHADGYGTLKLPNGTYNNVMRIIVREMQIDTIPFVGVDTTWVFNYTWFDTLHTSALLKYDSTYSTAGYMVKSVSFLTNEKLPTGISDEKAPVAFTFRPNPASNFIQVFSDEKGEVCVLNQIGQVLNRTMLTSKETEISTAELAPGIYFLRYQTAQGTRAEKLTISR